MRLTWRVVVVPEAANAVPLNIIATISTSVVEKNTRSLDWGKQARKLQEANLTLKMLTTLLPPTSGGAWIDDYDLIHRAADVPRVIGYVPQNLIIKSQASSRARLDAWSVVFRFQAYRLVALRQINSSET
jgi:hypothetical protein